MSININHVTNTISPTSGILNLQGNSDSTNALKSASTTVNVSSATAPSIGQALVATDSTHATWQTLDFATNAIVSQYSPTTGQTVFANTEGLDETLYIYPASSLAALGIDLPSASESRSGQIIRGIITDTVSVLSITVEDLSSSVVGGISSAPITGLRFAYQYNTDSLSFNTLEKTSPGGSFPGSRLACSSDGQIVYASGFTSRQTLYKSINGGNSWNEILNKGNSDNYGLGVACSSDGQKVYVVSTTDSTGTCSYSHDGGSTWNDTNTGPGGSVTVACSSDGQTVITSTHWRSYGNPGINISINSGLTFGARQNITGYDVFLVACSADGQVMMGGGGGGRFVAYSINGGLSWNSAPAFGPTSNDDEAVNIGISPDGSTLWAVTANGKVYSSPSSSVSWTLKTTIPGFTSFNSSPFGQIAISSDNSIILIGYTAPIPTATKGYAYLSNNSGNTWTNLNIGSPTTIGGVPGVAMSSDGTILFSDTLSAEFFESIGTYSWIRLYSSNDYTQDITTTAAAGTLTGSTLSSGVTASSLTSLGIIADLNIIGFSAGIISKTANYTATSSDYTILCDATSGNITITLPAAASNAKRIYNIKKIDSSSNTITIDGNASETIDGATTQVISSQWNSYSIQCNGTAWYII